MWILSHKNDWRRDYEKRRSFPEWDVE